MGVKFCIFEFASVLTYWRERFKGDESTRSLARLATELVRLAGSEGLLAHSFQSRAGPRARTVRACLFFAPGGQRN